MINEAIYGPALALGFAAYLAWCLVQGFRSGTMRWDYLAFHISGNRRTEPGKFWSAAVVNAIFFSLLLLGGIAFILWPRGIGG